MFRRAAAKREFAIVIAMVGIAIAIVGGYSSRAARDREVRRLIEERDAQVARILATRPATTTNVDAGGVDDIRRLTEEYDRRIEAARGRR